MERGAIIRTTSIAERHPAAPVGTPQRNTEIIAIPLAHGASTVIRSTDVQKPVRPVARLPMTMLTTAIPMVHGRKQTMRSISAQKLARFVRLPVMNTPTMWMPTATASATIAAQPSA